MTEDKCRAAILEHLKAVGGPKPGVKVTADEGDKPRAAAADALSLRCGMAVEKPADGARELRGMSLRRYCRSKCLVRDGQSDSALRRMSSDDLYSAMCRQYFNPTAAFPAILDETIRPEHRAAVQRGADHVPGVVRQGVGIRLQGNAGSQLHHRRRRI